jgi:hypothetical protein
VRHREISRLYVPKQYEVIDMEDEGSGSLSGSGDSVLRVFKAGELFDIVEADLQGPAQSNWFRVSVEV